MTDPTIPANVPDHLRPFWREPNVTQQRDAEFFTKTTRLVLGQLDSTGQLNRGGGNLGFGVRDVPTAAERHIRARLERDPKHAAYRTIRARKLAASQGPPPEFTAYVADALASGQIDSQGADEMHGAWVRVHNRMATTPNPRAGEFEYALQEAWVAVTMDDLREFWAEECGIPEAQGRWEAHVAALPEDEQRAARELAAEAAQRVEQARAGQVEQAKSADRQKAAALVVAATIERDQAAEDRQRAATILAVARDERKAATAMVRQAEEARADAAALLRRAATARHQAEDESARAADELRAADEARAAMERAQRQAEAAELARAEAVAARRAASEEAAVKEAEQQAYNRSIRGRWNAWRLGARG